MKIDDRKLIVNHIIDKEFVPALVKKLDPFIKDIANKRMYVKEYEREIGFTPYVEPTVLDIKPELELLSEKLCRVFAQTYE